MDSPWVQIPACSPVVHQEIASDFVGTVPNKTIRDELEKAFLHEVWWPVFFTLVGHLGLGKSWITFRRRRLWAEFKKAITDLDIPLRMIVRTGLEQPGISRSEQDRESSIREITLRIVGRLPASELRNLRLPLGYVIDELDQNF